jgi:hypothetical protein
MARKLHASSARPSCSREWPAVCVCVCVCVRACVCVRVPPTTDWQHSALPLVTADAPYPPPANPPPRTHCHSRPQEDMRSRVDEYTRVYVMAAIQGSESTLLQLAEI